MSNDVVEIIRTINLYALATDTLRWDLFEQIFTLDVVADCPPNGVYEGRDRFIQMWDDFHKVLDRSTHTFTNHQVVVNGDRANALSYVQVRLMQNMPGGENFYEAHGWYDDKFVRTPAGWRIKARLYGSNWWRGNFLAGGEGFNPGLYPIRQAVAENRVDYVNAVTAKALAA